MDQINDTYKSALSKAAAICSGSEKCVADVKKKLEQWQVDPSIANRVIETLISEKFIDHTRYTTFFVRDKFRFNKWGKRKIVFELSRKAIDRDIIEEAINTIADEEYLEVVEEILKVKKRQIRQKDIWQTKAALMRYGLSKGFESDVVNRAIAKLIKIDVDNE